jgi:hypothetical protein
VNDFPTSEAQIESDVLETEQNAKNDTCLLLDSNQHAPAFKPNVIVFK